MAPQRAEPREQPAVFIGYEMATPLGDLRDQISDMSFRGFDLGALWPVYRGLYIGPVFNHHLFDQDLGTKTYQIENGAVTADLYRYTKTWTVAAAARYLFLEPDSVVRPFLGVRLGVNFATTATLVSDLSLYDSPIGFALAPEGGALFRLASFLQASLSVRYDFSTASSGALDNISYMAYHIGLVFHGEP